MLGYNFSILSILICVSVYVVQQYPSDLAVISGSNSFIPSLVHRIVKMMM